MLMGIVDPIERNRRRRMETSAVVRPFVANVRGNWWRIESPVTRGFPDIVGAYRGAAAFVECKHARLASSVGVSRDQQRMLAILPRSWVFALISGRYVLIRGSDPMIRAGTWRPVISFCARSACRSDWSELSSVIWGDSCPE